jgi:hypothetical protein
LKSEERSTEVEQKPKSNKHWMLWALLGFFILAAIGAMVAADVYYAPDANNPTVAPGAPEN